jgi:hypothetical protein
VSRRLVVEADGGSRGNPGPAGYGAVVRDADTGEVLAERAASLGRVTNNVAEYQGLLAGLRAAVELEPAAVEVRMDSKLVVEQMSGRWRVKHPDLQPLHAQGRELARALPLGTALIGINNRNLKTFEVSFDTAIRLGPGIPKDRIAVAESGIGSHADVERLREHGLGVVLVGESLMRQADVTEATRALLFGEAGGPEPDAKANARVSKASASDAGQAARPTSSLPTDA